MKQIFPKEILENTLEAHQFKHTSKSKVIYAIILLSILCLLLMLPFTYVDVYTSGRGIIKPDKERVTLTTLHTSKVMTSQIKNNTLIHKGDVLAILDSDLMDEKLSLLEELTSNTEALIHDLEYLLKANKSISFHNLKSSKYKKEYLLYKEKKEEKTTKLRLTRKNKERNYPLFQREVISRTDYEKIKFEFDVAENALQQFEKQEQNNWQSELSNLEDELLKQKSAYSEALKNKSQFTITAPISGTLLNVRSIEEGSVLSAGEVFAEISPNTTLRVECYLPPSDIGLLSVGNPVSFQVDAYNYNQWGVVDGKVMEINDDMEMINDSPMFKIICSLEKETLLLKNGFEGNLKKGMTLSTQFKIAERSLFDLLYDKTDDWLNPSQHIIAQNTNH